MSEVILKFILPDDKDDLKLAQKGGDFFCAIRSFQEYFHDKLKFSEVSKREAKIYKEVQAKLCESLEQYGIDLHGMVE